MVASVAVAVAVVAWISRVVMAWLMICLSFVSQQSRVSQIKVMAGLEDVVENAR